MGNILRGDLYRLGKSKLLYGLAVFTGITAFLLIMLNRQDIRLGISVFGELTAFKTIDDIVRIGVEYYKGLGILVAILISVFIGQEYQWKTWQHKWITSKSRVGIYLSKAILSSAVSVLIFLLFESVAVLSSGQMRGIMTEAYGMTILGGVFIYATLGIVVCMFAMLLKNSTTSAIVCLGYILFSETLVSVIKNIGSVSGATTKVAEWLIQRSLYGMSTVVGGTLVTANQITPILLNSLVIVVLSTATGVLFFRKYEL